MDVLDPAVNWLLDSEDPSIRCLTLTDVLGEPSNSREVREAKKEIPDGPIVKKLLSGQRADGGFGVHPYQKWTGAHWRLVSHVELGIPAGFQLSRTDSTREFRREFSRGCNRVLC
jgi:hypothetical protein